MRYEKQPTSTIDRALDVAAQVEFEIDPRGAHRLQPTMKLFTRRWKETACGRAVIGRKSFGAGFKARRLLVKMVANTIVEEHGEYRRVGRLPIYVVLFGKYRSTMLPANIIAQFNDNLSKRERGLLFYNLLNRKVIPQLQELQQAERADRYVSTPSPMQARV